MSLLEQIKKINLRPFLNFLAGKILVVVVIGLLVFGFFSAKSCKNAKGQLTILKAELKQEKSARADEHKLALAQIKSLMEQEAILQGHIDSAETLITHLKETQGGVAHTLADLEQKRKELKDKDAIIANLDEQVAGWKHNDIINQDIIKQKDIIIFSWEQKYNAQVAISLKWESEYQKSERLSKLKDDVISKQDKQISWMKFTGIAKDVIGGAAIVVAVLSLLKVI